MEDLALKFFPYPHVLRGERKDGVMLQWPERCSNCDRQCQDSDTKDLALCSYGLNYQHVNEELLIAGVVVSDYPTETDARRKMRKRLGRDVISKKQLDRVVAKCKESTEELEAELRGRLDAIVEEYRTTKGYQTDIVEALKPQLEQTLAQVHDYKQFVQQIVQNVDVLLDKRFPGVPLEEKLDQASHEEAAIYWSAVVMDEKLDAALFLESPKRIQERREQGRCRLHGMVVKYTRIYKSRADQKKVDIRFHGDSWGEINGNTRALGIIPHTLIDNAVKYAPNGSHVDITFEEDSSHISFEVTSLGPRIKEDEMGRIFDLFYRGHAARRRYKEGTGFGLASAQNIARAHDTQIIVTQEPKANSNGDHRTTFSVRFNRAKASAGKRGGRAPTGDR